MDARYNELAMLCLIGMDLNRWLEQCVETASANPTMGGGIPEGAFIAALLFAPPTPVQQKLHMWGVWNYQIIFSRAIGLNAVFPHPPHVRFEIYASGESYLERVWSE